ncbi:MAG TPA: sigma-70 region 4 domain-containing protein [Solirubrobacteraceae bacterium]|nr:sigma-70 region 4 domain-containing protein [Solirubrobacteraceae bacterium]
MSRLDDLPPDQRATLSLLLRSRKSYADVAALLEIPERAVRDRAHAALAVLAPAQARALSAEQREEVGDYMLAQRSAVAERLATRTYLDSSPAAHAWASALAAELQPLAAEPLPEIPPARDDYATSVAAESAGAAGGASPSTASGTPPRLPSRASSRRAGAVLLGVIAAVVIVVVVIVVNGGSSSKHGSGASASATSSTAGSGAETSTSGAKTAKAKEDKRITLVSPDPSSDAAGIAEVLSEGSQYAFYLAAEHLPPSKGTGFFYALWLYNSPSSFEALSRAPAVGSSGSVQGGALLPKDAAKYHTMLLTRETSSKPTSPGPIVLRGSFALH